MTLSGRTWKLTTKVPLCGALLALPVAAAAYYTAWHTTLWAGASCQSLRASILSVLEGKADVTTKQALVQKDLAAFERSCALTDPEAKAVYAALDRTILFTGPGAAKTPVRFVPPPPGWERRWPGHLPPPPEEFRRRPFGT